MDAAWVIDRTPSAHLGSSDQIYTQQANHTAAVTSQRRWKSVQPRASRGSVDAYLDKSRARPQKSKREATGGGETARDSEREIGSWTSDRGSKQQRNGIKNTQPFERPEAVCCCGIVEELSDALSTYGDDGRHDHGYPS